VDVGDDPGAGAGAAPGPAAAFALGSTQPAADGVELAGPVEHVHIGVVVKVGEGFVEGVGGGPAVEGVLRGDVLELTVPVEPTDVAVVVVVVDVLVEAVVGAGEAVAADVVEGIGAAFAEAALVGGPLGVGVVGPGIERGGDVQERGRGQVGVDLTATEQPLGQRHRVAGTWRTSRSWSTNEAQWRSAADQSSSGQPRSFNRSRAWSESASHGSRSSVTTWPSRCARARDSAPARTASARVGWRWHKPATRSSR
jgi:hypothetical protein